MSPPALLWMRTAVGSHIVLRTSALLPSSEKEHALKDAVPQDMDENLQPSSRKRGGLLLPKARNLRADSESTPSDFSRPRDCAGSDFLQQGCSPGPSPGNPHAFGHGLAVDPTAMPAPELPREQGSLEEPLPGTDVASTPTTSTTPWEFPSLDGATEFPGKPYNGQRVTPANQMMGSLVSYETNVGSLPCNCNTNWYLDCGHDRTLQCDAGGAAGQNGHEIDFSEANQAAFCMTLHLCCSADYLGPKYDVEECKKVKTTDSKLAGKHHGNTCDQWGCSTCSRMMKDVDPNTGKWVEAGKPGVRPYGRNDDAYISGKDWHRVTWWFRPFPASDPRPEVKEQLQAIHVQMTNLKGKEIYFQICARPCTDAEFAKYTAGEYVGDDCDPAIRRTHTCKGGDAESEEKGRHRGESRNATLYKMMFTKSVQAQWTGSFSSHWGGQTGQMSWMDGKKDERCPDALTSGPCKNEPNTGCHGGQFREFKLKKNAGR